MSTTSILWASAILTYPSSPIAGPANTTLYISQQPVATVQVVANNGGIILPNGQALAIGAAQTSVSNMWYSLQASPASILFQKADTATITSSVSHALSVEASTSTTPAVSDPATTTNPTASAPTTIKAPNKASSGGVTSGAAAGIAIGCLVAGALIAGLVFWCCWVKRRTSRARDYEARGSTLVPQEKGFATKARALGSGSAASSPMSDTLPMPLEDKAITGEISKISSSIKNHVQSYYHADRVNAALLDLDDIQALGYDLPVSAGMISTLLGNSATREIALRFCIAWVVCSRILPGTDSRTSLLPLEVAKCSEKIASVQTGSSGASAQAHT